MGISTARAFRKRHLPQKTRMPKETAEKLSAEWSSTPARDVVSFLDTQARDECT